MQSGSKLHPLTMEESQTLSLVNNYRQHLCIANIVSVDKVTKNGQDWTLNLMYELFRVAEKRKQFIF